MRFLLIDSNAIAYQSFYAFRELRTKSDIPVGALFGFSKKLLNLLKYIKPDHVIATFDSKGKKERQEVYAEYKANRKPMPDDMVSQMALIKEFLSYMNIAVVEEAGCEADDLIGSLAESIKKNGNDTVIIYTPDKDMLQLIDTRVSVIRSLKDDIEYTPEVFSREFDMTPTQFIDYLAIMGDASDNIPGVSGIGPKGAKKLIDEFGTVDILVERIKDIKNPRVRQQIEDNLPMLKLSRELVTIQRDREIPYDLNRTRYPQLDTEKVRAFFTRFDFMSLLRLIPVTQTTTPTQNTLFSLEENDTEMSVVSDEPHSYAIWFDKATISIWNGDTNNNMAQTSISDILNDKTAIVITYDARDLFSYASVIHATIYDVRVCEYWHGYSVVSDSKSNFALKYNVRTARDLYRMFLVFKKVLIEHQYWDYVRISEFSFIKVLYSIESHGICVNESLLEEYERQLSDLSRVHEEQIYRLSGETFNIRSPKQIAEVLFEKMKIEPPGGVKKTKTGLSTDEDVLTAVASVHPVGQHLLEYRKLQKILSTYVLAYKDVIHNGRLHTTFDYCGTATGRLSSQNPNLQNIPVHGEWGDNMRSVFIAPPGKLLISADYSQMELRVLAHFSRDPALLEIFTHGRDIHSETAKQLFGSSEPEERSHAKAINFGIVYGQSAYGLADQLGIAHHAAREYIKLYFERFKGVRDFLEAKKNEAREKGYVSVLSGRRRYVQGITSNNRIVREAAERVAINTPIQGSAADIIKSVMLSLHTQLANDPDIAMILQVHDELLFEVTDTKADYYADIVKTLMENSSFKLSVPMTVSVKIGTNWKEAH